MKSKDLEKLEALSYSISAQLKEQLPEGVEFSLMLFQDGFSTWGRNADPRKVHKAFVERCRCAQAESCPIHGETHVAQS